jgi:FixJ family two-component response regulator
MDSEATVFVVDEDTSTREAVCDLASAMNLRTQAFASGKEFLACHARSTPGCIVLELMVPGINGLEIQQRLADEGSLLPIIFLTAHCDVSFAVEAMRAGAVHFLPKPFHAYELWKAIEEAIHLNHQRCEQEAARGNLRHRFSTLTARERQVLAMLGQGKAIKEIASELNLCVRTIEVHRARLVKKLGGAPWRDALRVDLPANNHSSRSAMPERII